VRVGEREYFGDAHVDVLAVGHVIKLGLCVYDAIAVSVRVCVFICVDINDADSDAVDVGDAVSVENGANKHGVAVRVGDAVGVGH